MEESHKNKHLSKPFIEELKHFNTLDKFSNATAGLDEYLSAKKRRLSKKGITLNQVFSSIENDQQTRSDYSWSYRDLAYIVTRERTGYKQRMLFRKGDKVLYDKINDEGYLMTDVIDVASKSDLPKDEYTCPNCGSVSTADVLATSGCQFCGAHFKLPELYPKVSHYSYEERQGDSKFQNKPITIVGLSIGIVAFVISFIIFMVKVDGFFYKSFVEGLLVSIVYWVMCFVLGGVAVVIPVGILYNIFSAVNRVQTYSYHANARKNEKIYDRNGGQFETAMRQYSAVFNYDFFSSSIFNSIGSILFAESEDECLYYDGPAFVGRFDDIVEYNPKVLNVRKFMVTEDRKKVMLDCEVTADIYRYVEGGIYKQKKVIRFPATRSLQYPLRYRFSARAYKCDGCGSSFDVKKDKECPYCGRPQHVKDYEWVISGPVEFVQNK